MNTFKEEIVGKKVLVFGLGRQGGGIGDANWLVQNGARVRATDQKSKEELGLAEDVLDAQVELALGGHKEQDIDWAEIIIKNPGVPDDNPLLMRAKQIKKPVLTSIAVFVKYAPLQVVGITGTRGKSTTTALITALLEKSYPGQVITGGNIPGTSGLTLLDQVEYKKYAVLELSSFQLHNFRDLQVSPNIAVVTNLYPDHLNRYSDMASYQKDKEALVAYQKSTDVTLANQENEGALEISKASTGQVRYFSATDVTDWTTSLPGGHNRENIAAMWAVGTVLDIPEEVCRQVVKDFRGLPFRQEKIRELDGVIYVNDTTSTTPTAAIKALQAARSPIIWITGGDTKKLPFTELIKEVKANKYLKKIVILGSKNIPDYTSELQQVVGDKIVGTVTSMKQAVELARDSAVVGETILLSPGFASFDLFQNEFDRGRQFNDVVRSL